MPYLGNTAGNRFVASKAATQFSGDGSTTVFTLDHAVGSDEDILVSVDGVIQEPSVAYAVSSGTTLTFTGAPSSNSGNNIFVYYLFRTVGTVGHPSNQALTATNGTLTGTLAVTGATTLSSDVTIGDASAADKKILFDGNAQDFHIGLDDSNDSLTLGLGSALGTTPYMVIDASGHITKPLQSAFHATKQNLSSSDQDDLAVGGSVTTITFDDERFDQNSDFNTSTSTFTAPVTGKYYLKTGMYLQNIDSAASYIQFRINTSNKEYISIISPDNFTSDINYYTGTIDVLADMDASDTATVRITITGGVAQADVQANSSYTYFVGYLVA